MMCQCERCAGVGQIECPDCGGDKERFECIAAMYLDPNDKHYQALLAVQADAREAKRNALRLTDLNPSRADSYKQMLRTTLNHLNDEADRIVKGEK